MRARTISPQAPTRDTTNKVGRIQWTARGGTGSPAFSLGSTTRMPPSPRRATEAITSGPTTGNGPEPRFWAPTMMKAEDPRTVAEAIRQRWIGVGHQRASTAQPLTIKMAAAAINAVTVKPHTCGFPTEPSCRRRNTATPHKVEISRMSDSSSALPSRMCSKKSMDSVARKVSSNRLMVPAKICWWPGPIPSERPTHPIAWKTAARPSPTAASLVPAHAHFVLESEARMPAVVSVASRRPRSAMAERGWPPGRCGNPAVTTATDRAPMASSPNRRSSLPPVTVPDMPRPTATSPLGMEDCIGLNIGGPGGVR